MLILDYAAAIDRIIALTTEPTVPELFLLSAPATLPLTPYTPGAPFEEFAPPSPLAPIPAHDRTLAAAATAG